ncbi:hypothetical protein H0G86_013085 [Trichoderma simmonsii]|uniref:Uncharacterized protein n=1 Tax=Trichoderma simmonsii TaxID=1491479 RepID=A0A8G0LPS1_9HYPO|nr:hypothetical protein H0G86_013085 [Trichoderma simmonsii]
MDVERGIGHSGISEAKRENKLSSAVFLICGTRQFDGWHGIARIQASHDYPHTGPVSWPHARLGLCSVARQKEESQFSSTEVLRDCTILRTTRSDYLNVCTEYQWTLCWTGPA